MTARWFTRDRDEHRSPGYGADPVEDRIERQARRAGRTIEQEQERILRDVLPNVRRTVAEAGLTMGAYLQLNRVEYEQLLAEHRPTRSLFGRNSGLIDYDAFARLRRWVEAAAERAGEDVESWVARAAATAPRRPWQRSDAPAPPTGTPAPASSVRPPADDDVIDRLERLAALRDSGALTEEEFRDQKRRLLSDG